jgi:hypothetical protein
MTKTNYETFKGYAVAVGGVIGAVCTTYITTVYLPARIISGATAATTAALNTTLGSAASWIPGTIADTAAVAGAEAYIAAKNTGYVGSSMSVVLGSATLGYTLGSKAVDCTFTGMEKVVKGIGAAATWSSKITNKLENQVNSSQLAVR